MENTLSGRARILGDNIDTDQLAPGQSISQSIENRLSAMLPNHRQVADAVQVGDFLVAGRNFGCGSSREQAVENLMELGVRCVIAESFARIFFRNAVANALPVLICPEIARRCSDGDTLRFDWNTFSIENLSKKQSANAAPYTEDMMRIIKAGGMLAMLAASRT